MRLLWRALAALVVLLLVAGVALALLLPRLVDRPEVRARIEAAARDATGRELRYDSLAAGLLPPRIEVVNPSLAGEAAGEPPLFAADRVALRLALLPLLARSVVIDRLLVDGARIRLVRPDEAPLGQAPPTPAPSSTAGPGPSQPGTNDSAEAPAQDAGPALGVRSVDVSNATLTVEDRSVSPPVTLVFEDIQAHARATNAEGPITYEASLRLGGGGDVVVEGTATLAGAIDAEATLSAVEAEPFRAYLGNGRSLAGRLGGTVRASGPARAPDKVDARLVFENAAVEIDSVKLNGRLALSADLVAGEEGLGGPFEIDATDAELGYAGAFHKPPGTAATTSGTLEARPGGGFDVKELRVKIKNFEAQGSLDSGERSELALAAAPFDLAGWEALLPALGDASLGGRLALDGLRAETTPLDVAGAVVLDGVRFAATDQPPVVLRGRIEGAGNAIRSRELALDVAGQPVAVDLAVAPLSPSPRVTFAASGRGLDVAALIGAFSKSEVSITGPLRFDARFEAPLDGEAPIAQVLSGKLDFDLGPGRFQGVSLLRDTLERAGPVAQAAIEAGKTFGGRDVKRLYDDRFESIAGIVHVGGGFARFDPIRALYRDYRVDLRGSVRLADRALDATGRIVFADAEGAGALRGQTLPISRIGGTLDSPRVELSKEDVAKVASAVSGSVLEKKLAPVLERLQKKTGGKSPLDALQNLFGGKKN